MKKLLTMLLSFQAFFKGSLFAEGAEVPPGSDQGFSQTLVMIAIALVFFYFILWRPEQKRRKAADELRNRLQKGDRVTAMGIIGTVSQVESATVILKMYDGSQIEVLKAAISDVMPSEAEVQKAEK